MGFRLGYVVSGQGRLLRAMCNAQKCGIFPFELAEVISDRPCEAIDMAKKFKIPTRVAELSEFSKVFAESKADAFMFNFSRLVPGEVVARYPGRLINIHFSLLPAFTGFKAIEKAAEAGVKFTGVTTHFIDETTDQGPIIAQAVHALDPRSSAPDVGKELFKLAVPLQMQTIAFIAEGRIKRSGSPRMEIAMAQYGAGIFNPGLEGAFKKLPEEVWKNIWD